MTQNPQQNKETPSAQPGSPEPRSGGHGASRSRLLAAAVATGVCLTGAAWAGGSVIGGYIAGTLSQAEATSRGELRDEDRNAYGESTLAKAGYSVSIAQHDLSAYLDGTLGFASSHVPGNTSCGCPGCCGEVPQVIEQAPPNPGPSEASAQTVSGSTEEV